MYAAALARAYVCARAHLQCACVCTCSGLSPPREGQPIYIYIYITSPNLGSFDTVSNFSNNIIKQVPVTSDYGYTIVDRLVSFADYLNRGSATLKILEFHMRDGRGNYVNLYNNHVSCTIVFDTK